MRPKPSAPLSDQADATLVQGRFELLSVLGTGGYGTVYKAFDCASRRWVALKVLDRVDPAAVQRFKREFRALHGVPHRNLVELYELIESDGRWMLAMELVEGEDLCTFVRRPQRYSLPAPADNSTGDEASRRNAPLAAENMERLRACLAQLVQGVMALHAAGCVHRDIKPSNVRVSPSGRVVLLDFGMVTTRDEHSSSSAAVVGTAAYMAPEQAAGVDATPATDLYSIGVILFEVLTGVLPFTGPAIKILMTKQAAEARAPAELAPEVPQDLDELCRALLRRSPHERPKPGELLNVLGAEPAPPSLAPQPLSPSSESAATPPAFVGRERELEVLASAFAQTRRGNLACVVVDGESGVGKSRLLRHFAETLREPHPEVTLLRGRCYQNETLPYKALDGVVGALARELRRLPTDTCRALLPRRAGLLPLAFPVLGTVPAITELGASTRGAQDRLSLRGFVFTALRELLARLAELLPVVVLIDDMQWSDGESLALLTELFRPPSPPGVLLLLSTRDVREGGEVDDALHTLSSSAFAHKLDLKPLERAHTEQLVRRLLPGGDAELTRQISLESAGHPLFVETLVRYASTGAADQTASLDDALASHIQALPDHAKHVLGLLCVAGAPVPVGVLRELGNADAEEFSRVITQLRMDRLVRAERVRHVQHVEPFHDRVRLTVSRSLSPEDRTEIHRQLARALELEPGVDRERVAFHWHQAGQNDRAARSAALAGDIANEALAFAKAARVYRWSLQLAPERSREEQHPLLLKLAEALVNAGHCSRAADVFLEAVEGAPAAEAIELRRRAAESLLQSGRIEAGKEVGAQLLSSVGLRMPTTRTGAIASAAWAWAERKLGGEAGVALNTDDIPHERLLRTDILWSLSSALGSSDPFVAAALSAQHYLYAVKCGEPGRLARAMAMDTFGLYFMGRADRVPAQLTHAHALAERSGSAQVKAFVAYCEGSTAIFDGRTHDAKRALSRTVELLEAESRGNAWLLGIARANELLTCCEAGDWKALAEQFPATMRRLEERGDPYAQTQGLLFGAYVYHLMHDRPDLALAAIERARKEALAGGSESVLEHVGRMRVAAYNGDLEGYVQLLDRRRELQRSGALRMPANGAWMSRALGVAALKAARHGRLDGRRATRAVARELKLATKSANTPQNEAIGLLLLQTAVAMERGEHGRALDLLARVEVATDAVGRRLYVQVARVCRGQLEGGTAGQARVEEVAQELHAAGVRRPLRFLAALEPGLVDLDSAPAEYC